MAAPCGSRSAAAGKFLALTLDPEFLKEDAKFVGDTVLAAVQDAAAQAKACNDAEMQKVTAPVPDAGDVLKGGVRRTEFLVPRSWCWGLIDRRQGAP